MTTRSDGATDDDFWRRPAQPEEPAPPSTLGRAAGEPAPAYPGPPVAPTLRPGWRPPVFVQPPPPRQLPAQDLARMAAEERTARTITYGIGAAAGVVLLVVICLLCSRILI
ncbi:MAG TPA: translation initiation factor 2 [Micromonospora sp.]|nr:translation initiation factor 2 [Micromonospora sp.]